MSLNLTDEFKHLREKVEKNTAFRGRVVATIGLVLAIGLSAFAVYGGDALKKAERTIVDKATAMTEEEVTNIVNDWMEKNAAKNVTDWVNETTDRRIPVGTVVAFLGTKSQIPKGWLLCNGDLIKAKDNSDWKNLIEHLLDLKIDGGGDFSEPNTPEGKYWARLPDLQGMFLRGAGENKAYDGYQYEGDDNFKPGDTQKDQIAEHTHIFLGHDTDLANEFNPEPGKKLMVTKKGKSGIRVDAALPIAPERKTSVHPDVTDATVGDEVRPKNMAVNYIIKY